MKRTERLLRDAKRHSLLMLLCITAGIIAICGAATGIQDQNGEAVVLSSLFTVALFYSALCNGRESWRLRDLHDQEVQFQNQNQTEP
jgi:hypothetical protein